jgi:hypothetical protein
MRYLYDIMDIPHQLPEFLVSNISLKLGPCMYVKSLFFSLILMCEFLFISINMHKVFHE